jgi:hypothetical protein
MYNELHGHKDLALAYGCTGVPVWQRRTLPRYFNISPAAAQPDELPASMANVVRELRAHPAGAHALRMFREQQHVA